MVFRLTLLIAIFFSGHSFAASNPFKFESFTLNDLFSYYDEVLIVKIQNANLVDINKSVDTCGVIYGAVITKKIKGVVDRKEITIWSAKMLKLGMNYLVFLDSSVTSLTDAVYPLIEDDKERCNSFRVERYVIHGEIYMITPIDKIIGRDDSFLMVDDRRLRFPKGVVKNAKPLLDEFGYEYNFIDFKYVEKELNRIK